MLIYDVSPDYYALYDTPSVTSMCLTKEKSFLFSAGKRVWILRSKDGRCTFFFWENICSWSFMGTQLSRDCHFI